MNAPVFQNLIGGKWRAAVSGATFPDINPADVAEVVGRFPSSSAEDVQAAVDAAQQAFAGWRRTPLAARENILRAAAGLLDQRREAIALELTREEGKTLEEARQEVASAVAEMTFQIGHARSVLTRAASSGRPDILGYTLRQPVGVVSIITPWNFPVNVVCRKITPALLAGNTVVFKPATFTPLTGCRLVEILQEAGIPAGVVNFVTGQGSRMGDGLLTHPAVRAISFTGSTEVGTMLCRQAAPALKKIQLEMGGKNAQVVLEDADLVLAARHAALAGYACSGQWCTSTSRVIVLRPVAGQLLDLLVQEAAARTVGNGLKPEVRMGPVAGAEQMEKILGYIELGKQEGARLAFGGVRLTEGDFARGFFLAPAVFSGVRPEMRIAQEEIFGPVISVITVDSFAEAVAVANGVQQGLCSSIHTRDLARALEFVEQTEVGLTHVNLPTGYKEPQLPFGGIKLSGYGLPESGDSGLEFCTEAKAVYVSPGC